MKQSIVLLIFIMIFSCSSTQLVEDWKNPEIDSYTPTKVLVIGLSSNTKARKKFERQLKRKLEKRGAEVEMSFNVLDPKFKKEQMTEAQLNELEQKLLKDGFDTILFSKVIGVEDKIAYKKTYGGNDSTYRKFSDDYLRYQDLYYNPDYYDEYTVYHAETAMYCICPTKERELLWKGYIDIWDPESIDETVDDYVTLVIAMLEARDLISPVVSEAAGTKDPIH